MQAAHHLQSFPACIVPYLFPSGSMRLLEGRLLQSTCELAAGHPSQTPLEGAPGAGAVHLDVATLEHIVASLMQVLVW